MRILILSDGIPPFVMGGMQKHSRLLAEYLARLGHSVTLFHYSEEPVSDLEVRAHFSRAAQEFITSYHFLYKDNSLFPGHYLRAQKKISERYLNELMKLGTFDFIYTKGFMGWALLNARKRLRIITPIGVKFHGMNMFQEQPNLKGEITKYFLRRPVRNIMNRADFVFSYGGRITEIIANELMDRTKIIEFPSGVSSDWVTEPFNLRLNENTLKFLFVGRFDRLKGIPEMNSAFQTLRSLSNWSLTHVGPIPERQKLLLPQIKYLGSLSDEGQLKNIYDDHDVLVCPSISEGMPNVIMEAMSRGLAIIATDVGATKILVSKKNGWLISSRKRIELERSIASAISLNKSELIEMKKISIEQIKNDYLWESIALRFVDWINNFPKQK